MALYYSANDHTYASSVGRIQSQSYVIWQYELSETHKSTYSLQFGVMPARLFLRSSNDQEIDTLERPLCPPNDADLFDLLK
jgi:hypothetical protein